MTGVKCKKKRRSHDRKQGCSKRVWMELARARWRTIPPDGALVVSQKRSYMDRERTQQTRMVDGSRRAPWPMGTDWRRCTETKYGLACGVSFSIVNKVIK